MPFFDYANLIIALIIFLFLIYAAIISIGENEKRAAGRMFLLAFLLPLPYLAVSILRFPYQNELSIIISILTFLAAAVMVLPVKGKSFSSDIPKGKIDERDVMFSRNEIKPGTERFEEYYKNNPLKKEMDDKFRAKPGLLKKGATHWNRIHFAASDASFETIGHLKNKVDGIVAEDKAVVDEYEITRFIKSWGKKLGAVNCGIAKLQDYHFYSVGGRGERYGVPVENKHKYAIAFTVEMDKRMMQSSPTGTIVMESAQQYLDSGVIAVQVAQFIRNIGYSARAHIDGNYEVVCPLVARDAGLGEIGRMGLLMTPELGPRVRIAVVTTDLNLIIDKPVKDDSVLDFCTICKKCADACPGKAISFEKMEMIDGVNRWQINQEACFTLWCTFGTDCGRCVAVCPYSHPDNAFHNLIRFGLKRSMLFRRAALIMDDFFYGRKPASLKVPGWLDLDEK